MERLVMPKGTVIIVDKEIINWDKVLHIRPLEEDGSKTKLTFENGYWLVFDKDIDFFKKEFGVVAKSI